MLFVTVWSQNAFMICMLISNCGLVIVISVTVDLIAFCTSLS